jgi:sugar (pentulose or hexulose) kinase
MRVSIERTQPSHALRTTADGGSEANADHLFELAVHVSTTPALPRGLWRYHVDRNRLIVGGTLGNGGNLHEWIRQTLRLEGSSTARTRSCVSERRARTA